MAVGWPVLGSWLGLSLDSHQPACGAKETAESVAPSLPITVQIIQSPCPGTAFIYPPWGHRLQFCVAQPGSYYWWSPPRGGSLTRRASAGARFVPQSSHSQFGLCGLAKAPLKCSDGIPEERREAPGDGAALAGPRRHAGGGLQKREERWPKKAWPTLARTPAPRPRLGGGHRCLTRAELWHHILQSLGSSTCLPRCQGRGGEHGCPGLPWRALGGWGKARGTRQLKKWINKESAVAECGDGLPARKRAARALSDGGLSVCLNI